MTKEEFNKQLNSILTNEEMCFINTNIYFNPEYIDYYTSYHIGDYNYCLNFLKENKHLLTIEKTPEEFKGMAKILLSNKHLAKNV